MKKPAKSKFWALASPLILILVLLAAACGAAAPQNMTIPVKLEAGKLNLDPIRVAQNDTITLKIETDQTGSVHLHGYDIEQAVKPGEVTDFVFLADASGRFKIEFHGSGDDHGTHEEDAGHGEEIQSEVLHPGDTFALKISHQMDGKTIPYHSHLHPEISGEVEVSEEAPAAETVQVEITDGVTEPPQVLVRPGTTIIWTNNSSEMQTVHSGAHPGEAEEEHETTGHEAEGGESEHGHDEGGEGEAIEVGFLEVLPR